MRQEFINEENFKKCNKPYKNSAEAEKQLTAFLEGVYKLRVKHKVANVSVMVACRVEGTTESFVSSAFFGDSRNESDLAVWYAGKVEGERKARLAKLARKAEAEAIVEADTELDQTPEAKDETKPENQEV